MATKYYSGRDGKLTFNGTQLAKVTSWGISANIEALETTVLSDNSRTYTPGIRDASGSCSVLYYDNAPVSLIQRVIGIASPTDLDKYRMILGFGDKAIEFDCIITSAELACSVGEIMTANVQFTVTGDFASLTL
jgi:hypothetical protein